MFSCILVDGRGRGGREIEKRKCDYFVKKPFLQILWNENREKIIIDNPV